ncbi:MAG: D-alanine--D-alanine ligase [Acidimicrobiia bacterium]|nr:D-alanine--D-alanine ligase [Acidimicrobiia bacterium]
MGNTDRTRLVVLFGGQSAEHEVSCVTAAHVIAAVDRTRFSVLPIGIDREGRWLLDDDAVAALESGSKQLPPRFDPQGREISPSDVVTTEGDLVAFPLLHGPKGEDGTIQGLLELAGIPYVGTGVLGSALAMDKVKARELLAAHGIPQTGFVGLRFNDVDDATLDGAADALGLPIFVKPSNMGSSVGVSRATTRSDLTDAVKRALEFDEWVLLEEEVVGRELETAVLGNIEPKVSVIGEIEPGNDFYDYEDKYDPDSTAGLVIPADIPGKISEAMQELALKTFAILRCEGMARVDMFWEETGRGLLVNEVNTIPGFTPISMYPKLWEASGIGYAELINNLVDLARERHARRSAFRLEM